MPIKDIINDLAENIMSDPVAGRAIQDLSNKRRLDETVALISGSNYVNAQDPLYYAGAFPTLFPTGEGCPNATRPEAITIADYMQHVLLINSDVFRKHIIFQFTAFDQIRRKEIFASVKMHVRNLTASQLQRLNDISLSDLKEALILKNAGNDVPNNHPAKSLMESLRIVGAKTNYSDHFKTTSRSELLSCIIQHGSPCLYITISPLDHRHILAFQIINRETALDLDNLPDELHDSKFRLLQASENPVSLAQFFHVLIAKIISHLFGYQNDRGKGLFGPLKSYYGMVESQGRGTLHIHMMLWIKNAPSPDTLYDKLCSDAQFKDELFKYLESILKNDLADFTVENPTTAQHAPVSWDPLLEPTDLATDKLPQFLNDAIVEYQTHKHMPSCYKNPRTKGMCRYRKPEALVQDTTFVPDTGEIFLKRHSPMINSFNPYLTCIANSNTDVSFLFRCKSSMSVIHYITNYITKSDDHVDNYYSLMSAAKQSLVETPMQSSITDLTQEQMSARSLLLRVYQKINSAVQIPSNIVATLLLNLPMCYKSDQ
jgi:hypothetical protein